MILPGSDVQPASAIGRGGLLLATLRRAPAPGAWLKPAIFLVALAPFIFLVYALFTNRLGANPIEAITHETGELTIRFLWISLALTPLRWLLKQTWPVRLRRMLGLFAFFYLSLHVFTYFVLDLQLSITALGEDLLERPYILAGSVGFLILLPLAITSPRRMARRLGKRWIALHRWVYIAAAAGVVHYVWLAKGDLIEPYVYLVLLIGLLAVRLVHELKASTPAAARQAGITGPTATRPPASSGPRYDRPLGQQ